MNTPNLGTDPVPPPARSYLWLIFVAVFVLQLAAWTAWIIVASKHQVEEVPLTTAPHR
jgi:hypothetical protein